MSSSFPNGISSMKLTVSTSGIVQPYEQEISSASLGNNVIQINEVIKSAFNNSPPGTIFNPSISVTYDDPAFPSVIQVVTPTVIPNYVPRIPPPPPPISLLANGFTIKYTGNQADVTSLTPLFIQANLRGTGSEWFAVVDNSAKPYITSYAENGLTGINYFKAPGQSDPISFNNIVTTHMTDMSLLFYAKSSFNSDIKSWDTSNVTNMNDMFAFHGAANNRIGFNKNINYWNVSNVTNMAGMFRYNSVFNNPLNLWNVSNVTNMNGMFKDAYSFNQPLNSWNTSNVTDMDLMFNNAMAFNQNISSWQVYNLVSKPTKPFGFDTGAMDPSYLPNWAMSAP
jgi:surface protein